MEDFALDFPGLNSTLTCLVMPLKSNSHGITGSFTENTYFLAYNLPLLEWQMGIILILTHLIRFFLKPFGISAFVSCILAGIILGPSGIGQYDFTRAVIFPHSSQDTINTITNLGYSMYMFLAAVKMDLGMVHKTGNKPLSIGITSTAIPFLISLICSKVDPKGPVELKLQDTRLAIIILYISLPVVADVIDQLKFANTEIGRLALASGLVADVCGIAVFIGQVFLSEKSVEDTMRYLLPILIFLLSLVFIFRPTVDWVIKNKPEGKPLSSCLIYVIMAIAIGSQVFFIAFKYSNFGLAPFLIGLALPAGAPLGSALVEKFGSFTSGVLMHILIPTAIMRVDFCLIFHNFANIKKAMIIMFSATLVKMASCMVPCLIFKMPINEAAAIAFILNYTGVVHLTRASINRDNGTFKEEVYVLATFYMLLNATILPIIIKKLYNPSRRYECHQTRNVINLNSDSELKILTCIYGQDNAESSIKLLNALHPTKQSTIGIYALHLVELIGRYVPLLISHSKCKSISTSTSQKIIYEFNLYEKTNWNSVSVQLFTSLSSFPLMHEDIINIALDKNTSLIILPLHRRWSVHGDIESEEIGWRNVNCSVLKQAPCSVGIFFSRGSHVRQRSTRSFTSDVSVCMIFFGGNDDREALVLAKRMLNQSEVTLTVVHFLPKYDDHETDEGEDDRMYDIVMLDEIKHMATENKHVKYRSHVVKDGSETVLMIRSIANQFEMFIIGRRYGVSSPQTSGLSEWSELPELGAIGDFFSSKDLSTRASVLVVQQQIKEN
ncbi:cation/H(+) antiporter 4-like [Euphorbia lathyris]|uniref:cation/H(+) antiporter 4-like n=1 Tax=Euphorbia lathyris TaxID=212925 RepID=UPI0033132954